LDWDWVRLLLWRQFAVLLAGLIDFVPED